MSAHTPGPWRVHCRVDRGENLAGTDEYFYIAAGTEEWFDNKGHFHPDEARYVIDEHEVVGLGSDRDYGYPEGGIRNKADAHLIAAAPELLAALKGILAGRPELWGDSVVNGRTVLTIDADAADAADRAIAKAEGR